MKKIALLATILGLIATQNVVTFEENVTRESFGFEIFKETDVEYDYEVVDEYIYAMEGYIA